VPRGTDVHVAADLDSDGNLDLVGTRTCAGCTSNQILLWGSRSPTGMEGTPTTR
jgi:hypothetical protein